MKSKFGFVSFLGSLILFASSAFSANYDDVISLLRAQYLHSKTPEPWQLDPEKQWICSDYQVNPSAQLHNNRPLYNFSVVKAEKRGGADQYHNNSIEVNLTNHFNISDFTYVRN